MSFFTYKNGEMHAEGVTLASIAFLLVVSDSTTGRMAALVLVAVDIWFLTNQRLSGRSSAALGAATGALVAMVGVAIGASLNAIADAAGKELQMKIDEAKAVAAVPMVRDARDMPREPERTNVDFTLRRRSVL